MQEPIEAVGAATATRPSRSSGFWATLREAVRGSERDFTEGGIVRAIFLLSVPMVLEMMMESLFGIVDAKFLLKHIRYAILVIFLISAIICPLPDPVSMCLFASPMLVLYMVGVGVAWFVHPSRRKAKETTAA